MDRPMSAGRLGCPTVYGQPPPPPPSQDSQSTYFSQVSPHPVSRWLTDPPAGLPGRGPSAAAAGEPSQDSAVSGLSQESGPCPAAAAAGGALRTKSAALEQRIDHERHQRRQLERDVREAVTMVAAHVQALPELWHALLPRLLAGVERAVQTEAGKVHQEASDRVRRLEGRLDGLDAVLRRAVEDACRQSDGRVASALHGLRQTVCQVEHRAGGTDERVQQLQRQLELDRSAPAAPAPAAVAVLTDDDREAARQLTSAAQQVTSAVSEVRLLSERLTEHLLGQQRQLALQRRVLCVCVQTSGPPVAAVAAAAPLAARTTFLTSPVGTVRPQPCLAPSAAAVRPQSGADGGSSPPSKQPRAGDVPAPQVTGVSRQAPRIAPVPHKQSTAALPVSAFRVIRATPGQSHRRPAPTGRKPRETPPPPPGVPRADPGGLRHRRHRPTTVYSPESEVTSLAELKGRRRPPAAAAAAATPAATPSANEYNFTWEMDEPPLPSWRRQAAVRTYSRTPQRTPLSTAARPAGSPQELIRRSVSRPCRGASVGAHEQGGDWMV